MNRPYLVVCPACYDSMYTGRKRSQIQADADVSRHTEKYDCDSVRIEENG